MERPMTERPKQPPLFEPDDLEDKIEQQADKMGWSMDSVRRMLTDEASRVTTTKRSKKARRGYKGKVPDNDSAYDQNWNVSTGRLSDEQSAINREGIALIRAAGQKPETPEGPHDPDKMVADAMASWDRYVAEHTQATTDNEVNERGVYVGLDDRHIALESIAMTYAHRNRSKGFSEAIAAEAHAEEIYERYRYPEIIASKMAETVIRNEPKLNGLIAGLTKEHELETIGFNRDDITAVGAETKQEIEDVFGEGVRFADREKTLKSVRMAAKKRQSRDGAE